ncbi:MAG: hypothetical protein E5Y18_00150 [Mesorhizobium sp.]|nr:MAG: hypothetical protein E5Y18_00150 [Mesorhizobium sp.]
MQVHHVVGHRSSFESGCVSKPTLPKNIDTAATPLARYGAVEGALASGFADAELHLYGAMIVKPALASFRPSPGSADWRPSPRPDLPSCWLPRAVTVKAGPQARSRSDLSLTVTSTAAGLLGRGALRGADNGFRGGVRHKQARVAARQTCIRSISVDLNHDAACASVGEAPGRRAHSTSAV